MRQPDPDSRAEMGDGRPAHDRGRHTGRRARWSGPGAPCAWAVRRRLGGTVRAARASSCAARATTAATDWSPAALSELGRGGSTCRLDAAAVDSPVSTACARAPTSFVDAMFGTGFRGRSKATRRWVRRRPSTRPAAPVRRRSTSRRACDGATGGGRTAEPCAGSHTVTFAAPQARAGVRARPLAAPARSRFADIGIDLGDRAPGSFPARTRPRGTASRSPSGPDAAQVWQSGALVVGGSGRHDRRAPSIVSHAAMRAGAGIRLVRRPGRDAGRRPPGHRGDQRSPCPRPPTARSGSRRRRGARRAADRFRVRRCCRPRARALTTCTDRRRAGTTSSAAQPRPARARRRRAHRPRPATPRPLRDPALPRPCSPRTTRASTSAPAGEPVGADRAGGGLRRLAASPARVVLLQGPGDGDRRSCAARRRGQSPSGGPWLPGTAGSGGRAHRRSSASIPGPRVRPAPFWRRRRQRTPMGGPPDVAPGILAPVAGDLIAALHARRPAPWRT